MIVYIEYVVLDNMIINSLVLLCSSRTTRNKIVWYRIVLSAGIGTILAICCVYVGQLLGYCIKIACVVVMSWIAVGKKKLFAHIILVVAYTFLLGGAIIGLMSIIGIDYTVSSTNMQYFADIPMSLYILAVVLIVVLVYMIVKYIEQYKRVSSHIVDVLVTIGDNAVKCSGYIDSGNTLIHDNVPVCFAFGALYDVTANAIATSVVNGSAVLVKYATVAGCKQSLAVSCIITIDGVNNVALIALSRHHSGMGYDILLNKDLLEGV